MLSNCEALPHCWHGSLERTSSLACFLPGWCTIVNWCSQSFSSNGANWPSVFLNSCSQVRAPWSVQMANGWLRRYCQKCCRNITTARSSCVLLNNYAPLLIPHDCYRQWHIQCPPDLLEINTAPITTSLASVSTVKGCDHLGFAIVGAEVRHLFRCSKVVWHSEVHLKAFFFGELM